MEDLSRVVRDLAAKMSHLLEEGEELSVADTKGKFVEPMLEALGWDIHGREKEKVLEVRRDFCRNPQDNPVDYALFISGPPRLVVQVQDPHRGIDNRKWTPQALKDANTAGVQWCVLTDGKFWHVYGGNAPGEIDRSEPFLWMWLPSVEDTPPPFEPTWILSLLSKEKLTQNDIEIVYVDRRCSDALREMVTTEDAALVRLTCERTGLTRIEVKGFLARAQVSIQTPAPPAAPEPDTPAAPPPIRGRKSRSTRKPRGVLTPHAAYCRPILQALVGLGGSAPTSVVIDRVRELMAGVLTPEDRKPLKRGQITWRKYVELTRLFLVWEGLLSSRSPRGIWEITDAGRQWLREAKPVPESIPGAKRVS